MGRIHRRLRRSDDRSISHSPGSPNSHCLPHLIPAPHRHHPTFPSCAASPHRPSLPVAIPGTAPDSPAPPPPLPPPRLLDGLDAQQDVAWAWANRTQGTPPPKFFDDRLTGGGSPEIIGNVLQQPLNHKVSSAASVDEIRPMANSSHSSASSRGRAQRTASHHHSSRSTAESLRNSSRSPPSQPSQNTQISLPRPENLTNPPGANFGPLCGEPLLERQNRQESSTAYDKHLLSRIGGPKTPSRSSTSSSVDAASVTSAASRQARSTGRPPPFQALTLSDSAHHAHAEVDNRAPDRWAPSPRSITFSPIQSPATASFETQGQTYRSSTLESISEPSSATTSSQPRSPVDTLFGRVKPSTRRADGNISLARMAISSLNANEDAPAQSSSSTASQSKSLNKTPSGATDITTAQNLHDAQSGPEGRQPAHHKGRRASQPGRAAVAAVGGKAAATSAENAALPSLDRAASLQRELPSHQQHSGGSGRLAPQSTAPLSLKTLITPHPGLPSVSSYDGAHHGPSPHLHTSSSRTSMKRKASSPTCDEAAAAAASTETPAEVQASRSVAAAAAASPTAPGRRHSTSSQPPAAKRITPFSSTSPQLAPAPHSAARLPLPYSHSNVEPLSTIRHERSAKKTSSTHDQPPSAAQATAAATSQNLAGEQAYSAAATSPVGLSSEIHMCDCCPKKPKRYATAQQLEQHQREKQYACAFCHNRFKNKNEAERHQNSLHVRRHSWSCRMLDRNYRAAFHPCTAAPSQTSHTSAPAVQNVAALDVCGYCGQEFPNFPQPDWIARTQHLTTAHKFGECNQSKKFWRADHFRQHLKHSHGGTNGKWTNFLEAACITDEPQPASEAAAAAAVAAAAAAAAIAQVSPAYSGMDSALQAATPDKSPPLSGAQAHAAAAALAAQQAAAALASENPSPGGQPHQSPFTDRAVSPSETGSNAPESHQTTTKSNDTPKSTSERKDMPLR